VEKEMIELRQVSKSFVTPEGQRHEVLQDLSFSVRKGEFCAIVGPSGCGKSTTLTLVSGLEKATSGQVLIEGERVEGVTQRASFMFQTDATFPWKNVLDNVAAGLIFRGWKKDEARSLAREWVARVGLAGFESHYPHQLSGGMRKRVALAQCLIVQPEILLMDESFSALDVHTRLLMEEELLQIWADTSASVLFVTHDLEEAIALADKVVVMTAGPASTCKGIYSIGLSRPRDLKDIRFDPGFIQIYQSIWEDLRSEVILSYERNQRRGAR